MKNWSPAAKGWFVGIGLAIVLPMAASILAGIFGLTGADNIIRGIAFIAAIALGVITYLRESQASRETSKEVFFIVAIALIIIVGLYFLLA